MPDSPLRLPIRRALVSVSDKTGLLPFVRGLAARGVEVLSTGGTARALEEGGVPVVSVEAYTGSPEVMGGRVKTLHPRVHGGILMRGAEDENDLARLGGKPIDLVVVNLYPFEAAVARGAGHEETVENVDIGGPSMLRSAAKNHARVAVVCDPGDYAWVLGAIEAGAGLSEAERLGLAAKAFARTAAYDGAIAAYLSSDSLAARSGDGAIGSAETAEAASGPEGPGMPRHLVLPFERAYALRYGENPHQRGAFYRDARPASGTLAAAASLGAGGKELSFNNLVDADAALEAVREWEAPAAVVIKHTNPCGVALGASAEAAFRAAREADPLSAFGGIVALNRPVDAAAARTLSETFLECVVAPAFDEEALAILRKKEKLRLLAVGALPPAGEGGLTLRKISGGLVVQTRDAGGAGEVARGRLVTRRAPGPGELEDLDFAWRVCKHVKSNAIVLASGGRTLGVGAGQMSRVESVRIAVAKAGEGAQGACLASDAFFPFPDGVELAAAAGVRAIVQPGGSVKDSDVIAAADAANVTMIFTSVRHFRH